MKKFEFNREFTDHVLSMTKVSDKGSDIIFTAQGGTLTVMTAGSEISVRRRFVVDTAAELSFAMKTADLEALLNAFTYGTIEVKNNRIILTNGGTNLERLTLPMDKVQEPVFPGKIDSEAVITTDVFEMASHVAYATAQTDAQPESERVAIMVNHQRLRAYALDGFRFAVMDAPCNTLGDGTEYLLRPSLITGLNTLIKKEKWDSVRIGSTSRHYLIEMGEFEVCTRRLEAPGKYTLIEAVLNKMQASQSILISVSRGELLRYLQRVSLVADRNERQPLVMLLNPDQKGAYVSFQSGTGRLEDVFDVEYKDTAEAISLALKPEFLLAACQKIEGSELTMRFTSPFEPVLIQETSGEVTYIHCVLPVRFDTTKIKFPAKTPVKNIELAAKVPVRPRVLHEAPAVDVDDSGLAS